MNDRKITIAVETEKTPESLDETKRQTKQVIVWRHELKGRTGKKMAQACHASMGALLNMAEHNKNKLVLKLEDGTALHHWLTGPFAKIVVFVQTEAELLALENKAKELGIPTCLITDAGVTEYHGIPTVTCLAIGPDWVDRIDQVTAGLPLL